MVIISKNDISKRHRYGRTQLQYAISYITITLAVLVFLNLYCSEACKQVFCESKEAATLEKAQLASYALGKLDSMTPSAVSATIEGINTLRVDQVIVTDPLGTPLYHTTGTTVDQSVSQPQISQALDGFDVFEWNYHNGVMQSEAAIPVTSNGVTVGCVYVMEVDSDQGALIKSLQYTILTITVLLELAVIVFSLLYSAINSKRMRKIMSSIRTLQEGDYSQELRLGGNDEFTVLAKEFNDLTKRLQTSERKRTQFVSDASHELKTPLASIKLLSDSILQNDMDKDTIREFVGDIGDEAERLNRMSEKLLSLTKGELAEENDLAITPMAPTIERVVSMLSVLADRSDVTIHTDLADDIPILIREDDLYQIAFNLTENGIKYNVPGGKLTITLSRGEDCGILTVADTGTGIPEDALGHIFERFYRVDKARSRASGGSGLGLAIVRSMVERNQGTIHVESIFGMGTTFTVEFPAFDIQEEEV